MKREPTRAQRRYLDFIRGYVDAHGYAPTWREIAAAVGCASLNAVSCMLRTLEKYGYLEIKGTLGQARCIVLAKTSATPGFFYGPSVCAKCWAVYFHVEHTRCLA